MDAKMNVPMGALEVASATPVVEQTVEVVAPADLQPGYQFTVEVEGQSLTVRVPSGGVKQGQRFMAAVVESGDRSGSSAHKIPTSGWRDGLCDCCVLGCCHAVCCLSTWMRYVALGQLQTRMKLDHCGNPVPSGQQSKAFKNWFTTWVVYMVAMLILMSVQIAGTSVTLDQNGNVVSQDLSPGAQFAKSMLNILSLVMTIYFVVAMIKTRMHIRHKYSIPETTCVGIEDCCCSFWCGCCTVSQMLRHTADYRTYSASCCDSDGLSPTAPKPV